MSAEEECREEKISFWSRFIDLYYKTAGGSGTVFTLKYTFTSSIREV